jgi:glycosyltransferase involved in cell wall biosynthesis
VEQNRAFYREYIVQRRRPHKYPSRSPAPCATPARSCFSANKDLVMDRAVSIIICTRNRVDSLRQTLESLGQATVPPGWNIELVVVDNGSTDSTEATVASTTLPNLPIRYVREERKGKGYAYNTGMSAARGQVFLFTDDDVRVPVYWIEAMGRPILDGKADAVQGGIRPAPHLERPWLTGMLRIWLAAVEDPVHPPEGVLVGANMAFGRDALEITGGFDPRLGPGAAGFYEDTLFGWALNRAGKRTSYQPGISVEHHFDPDRLKLASFISIAQRMATSRAIVEKMLDPARARPSVLDLLPKLPRLGFRCMTQTFKYLANRTPDPSFLSHYYQLCLWMALRKEDRDFKMPCAFAKADRQASPRLPL